MSELNELYQQVILDHNKNPRNFHKIEECTNQAEGHNPLCGDKIDIFMNIEKNIITDIAFQGTGCAISKSSASIMTSLLKGKTVSEAELFFAKFHDVVTSEMDNEIDLEKLGKLAVFSGVRQFPTRVKCASLAWHTMLAAVKKTDNSISTEL